MSQTIWKRAFNSATIAAQRGNLVDKFRLDLLMKKEAAVKASPFEVTSNRLMMTHSKLLHVSQNPSAVSNKAAKQAKHQRAKSGAKKAEYSLGHLMGEKKTRGLKANPFDVASAKLL